MSDQSQSSQQGVTVEFPKGFGTTGTAAGADEAIARKQALIDELVRIGYSKDDAQKIVDSAQQSGQATAGPPGSGTGQQPPPINLDLGNPPTGSQTLTHEQEVWRNLVNQFSDAYMSIWGVPPPPGYVASAINAGENIFEFTDRERQKPEYDQTKEFADNGSHFADLLATQGLGMR